MLWQLTDAWSVSGASGTFTSTSISGSSFALDETTTQYVFNLHVTPSGSGTCDVQGVFGGTNIAGGSADPHLRLAYGGMADFRGVNDTYFSMLSAPGVNMAMKTTDAVFMIKHNRRVDGSFMTAFAVTAMAGEEPVTVHGVAARDTGFRVTDQRGGLLANNGRWTNWSLAGVYVEQLMLTTSIQAHDWELNATRRPVYNHVSGPKWRFDFTLRPLKPEASWWCYPHGLIGQTFDGTGLGLLGKTDNYDSYDVKTEAMAEGVIEGSAMDYVVRPPNPNFKFSRFDKDANDHCKPRDPKELSGRRIRGLVDLVAGASD